MSAAQIRHLGRDQADGGASSMCSPKMARRSTKLTARPGLKGMCNEELRKLQVPYRLSRKGKSKVWKHIPNDEHWLTFNLEMLTVEPYSHQRQFKFLDIDSKGKLTEASLLKWLSTMRKEYGKTWKNEGYRQHHRREVLHKV
ncbi:hypothetical protein COOONC_18355, partial [Cooperia oncophora]